MFGQADANLVKEYLREKIHSSLKSLKYSEKATHIFKLAKPNTSKK